MEATSQFTKIFVIQSVNAAGLQTGRRLVDDALLPAANKIQFGVDFSTVTNRSDFFIVLDRALSETIAGTFPLIHIDAHGAEDKSGIALSPSGEIVKWAEFAERCREINRRCYNNLVITAGLCHGMHAITEVNIKELTPFFALVGAEDEVSAHEVDVFATFYNELLRSGDLLKASERLGAKFGVYLAERLFLRGYAGYVREHASGKGRQDRVERLVTEVRAIGAPLALRQIRRIAKKDTRPNRASFEKLKHQFLLSAHRRNARRFQLTFEDAMAYVRLDE